MLYRINFKELSEYFNRTIEDLKQETYASLEKLEEQMIKEKAEDQAKRNAVDTEFIRLTKKYFAMWHLLTSFRTESEVIVAVSKHMCDSDLVSEYPVREGYKCWLEDAEFVRTSWESLPRYTKSGEQLMECERAKCDVYRAANRYQHLRHGKVVLELSANTFPELKEFGYQAYGLQCQPEESYEIYPKNNIYTPFQALLKGDIKAIWKRNLDYAFSYNSGVYTVSKTEERLNSEEAKHYFDVIASLDRAKLSAFKKTAEKETA